MEGYEGIFDFETENIVDDLNIVKERARVNRIIDSLKLYENDNSAFTNLITEILEDENVVEILTKISREPIFVKYFPEFYNKNKYGEDVINCQQNSSYHKYGVFKHTLITIEQIAPKGIPIGEWQRKILKWTMLLHDIGKPYVKNVSEDGTESFAGHEDVSVELAKPILDRFYFTEDEKKVILTLIKYHDKFLNEGEIIFDNMKFLATELNNKKELFYMLIDVKDADASAKSIEVYNKYKLTKNKYIEFASSYFDGDSGTKMNVDDNPENDIVIVKEKKKNIEEISKPELDILIDGIISKKNLKTVFQPIINIKEKKVFAYEVYTRIDFDKTIEIMQFLNYTKETEMYDKVQQTLFINGITKFQDIAIKEANVLFVNSNYESYEKYINKPRVYEMMDKTNIVVNLQNYEKKDFVRIQKTIDTIHENNGKVAFTNFGIGSLTLEDLDLIKLDYLIPDISIIRDIENDEEKQKFLFDMVTYCISNNIEIIVIGIERQEQLDVIKNAGVKYVQGYYFQRPEEVIDNINDKIEGILSSKSNEAIV